MDSVAAFGWRQWNGEENISAASEIAGLIGNIGKSRMHSADYLAETSAIALNAELPEQIERLAAALSKIEGRVYMVGLGGSLANCIHMAADLRKLCDIDAVAPDNIAELTAWANDDGWPSMFTGYLENLGAKDAIFILSVGGGQGDVSLPILTAINRAFATKAKIFGMVGPKGGNTALYGYCVIKIPVDNRTHITPHTEAFQMVIAHCLLSHPLLQKRPTKW